MCLFVPASVFAIPIQIDDDGNPIPATHLAAHLSPSMAGSQSTSSASFSGCSSLNMLVEPSAYWP